MRYSTWDDTYEYNSSVIREQQLLLWIKLLESNRVTFAIEKMLNEPGKQETKSGLRIESDEQAIYLKKKKRNYVLTDLGSGEGFTLKSLDTGRIIEYRDESGLASGDFTALDVEVLAEFAAQVLYQPPAIEGLSFVDVGTALTAVEQYRRDYFYGIWPADLESQLRKLQKALRHETKSIGDGDYEVSLAKPKLIQSLGESGQWIQIYDQGGGTYLIKVNEPTENRVVLAFKRKGGGSLSPAGRLEIRSDHSTRTTPDWEPENDRVVFALHLILQN